MIFHLFCFVPTIEIYRLYRCHPGKKLTPLLLFRIVPATEEQNHNKNILNLQQSLNNEVNEEIFQHLSCSNQTINQRTHLSDQPNSSSVVCLWLGAAPADEF